MYSGATPTEKVITTQVGKSVSKIPFSIPVSAGNTHSFKVSTTPTENDVIVFVERTIGSNGVTLPGEDIWSATARATQDVSGSGGGTGQNFDMAVDIGSSPAKWAIGDRVTGTAELNAKTGANAVTITHINVGADASMITLSESVTIAHGTTLTFTEPNYFSWPINNTDGLADGMVPIGDNVTKKCVISIYENTLTELEDTINEKTIVKDTVSGVDSLFKKPTYTRNATTFALAKTQQGNVTFSQQQPYALAGDSVKFYSYGPSAIKTLTEWDIGFSDLKVVVTEPTTTTSAATTNSTTVTVASGDGIMDDVSTVSSVNIDSSVANPRVTNIGSYSGTTATLTLSSAQSFENGETLTFKGAGRTITISGNIEIRKVGLTHGANSSRTDWDGKIYFDLERFITATDES